MTIIDWDTLNATEVPKWLVALSSKDEERQFQAKMELSNFLQQHVLALNIATYAYNQILETDAPVIITPLLIEMLKDASIAKPVYITELLEIVASYIKEPTLGQLQQQRAAKIHELVVREFTLYLGMLEHPDPEVRVNILHLLRHIPEKREETVNALIHRIKFNQISEEIENLTAITMIFETVQTNIHTSDLRKDFIDVLYECLERDGTSTIELARAACYLILLQGDQVSQTIINTFVNILKEANFTNPGYDLGLSDMWIDALLSRGTSQATSIFLDIFDYQTDEYALINIGAILLELHFGTGDIHSLYLQMVRRNEDEVHVLVSRNESQPLITIQTQYLSDLQQEILKHLVQKEQIWRMKTNLFELFSLPTTQSELKKWYSTSDT